jgi:adenosyl cobinamide kinase/adenosyl cobinamide phosphate guanylyltransferase
MLTLVLGGARSGKSRYAENLLAANTPPWTYIATAEACDQEMATRIAQHRARRGPDWNTIEAPLNLTEVLTRQRGQPRLVDCLTLWLSNLLLAGPDPQSEFVRLEQALLDREADIVLVSNEVGSGIVPSNELARRFRDSQGMLNQRVASCADRVVMMVAGLPLFVKGNP